MTKATPKTRRKRAPPNPKKSAGSSTLSGKADDGRPHKLSPPQRRKYTRFVKENSKKNLASFNPARDVYDRTKSSLLREDILASPLFEEQCSPESNDRQLWSAAINATTANYPFVHAKGVCALLGLREAAVIVAMLTGENKKKPMAYCDWYCSGYNGPMEILWQVLDELERMGWKPTPRRDLFVTINTNRFMHDKLENPAYAKRFEESFVNMSWYNQDSLLRSRELEALGPHDTAALVAVARGGVGAAPPGKQTQQPIRKREGVTVFSDVLADLSRMGYYPGGKNLYPVLDSDSDPDEDLDEPIVWSNHIPAWHGPCENELEGEEQ